MLVISNFIVMNPHIFSLLVFSGFLCSLTSTREIEIVVTSRCFFRYQGHVGSSLIIGGVDVYGAHLYSVYPHGSYDKLPFLTMGMCLRVRCTIYCTSLCGWADV